MEQMSVEDFVCKCSELLEEERGAEIEETRVLQENVSPKELQRRGVCLLKLRVQSRHTGMYGRSVLTMQPFWPGNELPSHNLSPGDIVGISPSSGDPRVDQIASGIVSKVGQSSISVAFEESFDSLQVEDDTQYKLIKLANDVTYRRLKKALEQLNNYRTGVSSQLINILFGSADVSIPYTGTSGGGVKDLAFINPHLDESQQAAVEFALNQREVAVIHGPPGTGKTTTVVEIILQAVRQGMKILACAPSNIAVDNLVERIGGAGKAKAVRLGHPARILPGIQKYALDAILATSEETKLVEDVRKDLDITLTKMRRTRNKGERQSMREEMKYLRKELHQRETAAVREILKRADVVLGTLTSATEDGPLKHLDDQHFDLVVIDECSQSLEAACWIALLKGPRCILAGDHQQLPPTIISHKAAKGGLEVTLMERVLKLHGDKVMRMLTMQYRMHELIMNWSSEQLYHGKLVAHESVAKHLLKDLPGIETNENTTLPLLLIDTAGCDLLELETSDEVSKGNEGEAGLVTAHVESLITSGLSAEDIAVIAPYNLQVDLLRLRLSAKYPKLEVKSVDGFQGREKEAVVISLVRSNNKGEVGFLAEDRRINVAITRARRHLAVICDSETVSHHAFLKSLVDYLNKHGEVRSAHQYQNELDLSSHYELPEHIQSSMTKASSGNAHKEQKENSGARPKANQAKKKKENKRPGTASGTAGAKPYLSEIKQPTDEDKEELLTSIETEIMDFMADQNRTEHSFPSSLSSRGRFVVHEIAERLGITHISQGEGQSRHIMISKQPPAVSIETKRSGSAPSNVQREKDNNGVGTRGQNKKEKRNEEFCNNHQSLSLCSGPDETILQQEQLAVITCERCLKKIPSQNYELHSLRCSGSNNATKPEPQKEQSKTKKKNKKPKSAKNEASSKEAQEEDFDALIAEAMTLNGVCNFHRCKTNVLTLGQNCEFCAKRFCLAHHIPEVHGCGDAAKSRARMLISKEGVIYRGSGVPNKKPDPAKRAHLQRKLDSKLHEFEEKRQTKKKDKGK